MGTWGEVLEELTRTQTPEGAVDFDGVRRRYLRNLADYTKNNTIVYETAGFSPPQGAGPADVAISLDPDMAAFMEVVHGLPRDKPIDLILHSPGGTAEAAEAIVRYLRGRFPGLRVIVPVAAMSAASMMSMAADEIVMGSHSQLGPIDPQITIATPEGPRSAPAAAIIQQFEEAQEDLMKNPGHTAAWLPILRSYAPALLQICQDAEKLSKAIVAEWLGTYMFCGQTDASTKAKDVANFLGEYKTFKSHARGIDRDTLRGLGLRVTSLEDDQLLQDLVLSVHHAISHLIDRTGTTKIVENHMGKAWIRRMGLIPVPPPQDPATPKRNRHERRAATARNRKGRGKSSSKR